MTSTAFSTLLKTAINRRPGLPASAWAQIEARAALPIPDEVCELYAAADGATFPGDICLWSWSEVEEHTPRGLGSLKSTEAWLLGTKRRTAIFFAALPRQLMRALPPGQRTNWLRAIPPAEFVYGLWRTADDVFVVRSFAELLAMSIPRPGEDFGEVTFVRAMSAVKAELDKLQPAKKPKRRKR